MLGQKGFSCHEDDDDRRRDPEDHATSDQIAKVHEHDCSLSKRNKSEIKTPGVNPTKLRVSSYSDFRY